jgi:hypothetical protein
MRTEIYIENQRLDLYKDISAEFTYNIDDVKDFSSRNTNFSKTIVIPGNATNNKLFGHIFEFGNSNFYNPSADNVGYNFNAAKSAACVVYVDKIQIFKGVIRLLEIIIDNGSIEYECAVFGELGGLVSAIGNAKLEDLDFSAYNHVWSKTNIVNSWDQASGTTASGMGYFYPLIDYGQVSHNNKLDFEIGAFRPALFVREYMKKIIEGAGYTWESAFFDTNLFKRLVIPNNQKVLSSYSTTAFKSDVLPKFDTTDYYAAAGSTIKLEYPSPSIAGSFTASNNNTRFTYTGASTISITVTANVNGSYEDTAETMYFAVVKNGTTEIAASNSVENLYDTFDFTFSGTGTFATNDYFEVIAIRQNTALDYRIFINSGNIELNTDVAQAVALNLNETIQINKILPRGIFQKDFFASIVKMFNLYVTESTEKTKHIIIEPYIDYYDFNDTIDWTLKIDRSKPFRLKPMSELNGRYFEYKYKTDADFYNENYSKKYSEGYADYIEDTGYEFANDKQTAEIIFASSPLVGYAGKDKIMTAIFKKSNTQNTESEDTMDSVIRIMQVRKITGVDNWHIKNTVGGNIGSHLNDYGYGGHLDDPDAPTADINFGAPKEIYFTLVTAYPTANLFNGYWGDYVAEISDKDSKLLTCNVRLTDMDIYNLDFSKPIWIDGTLWRLNKVMDYNPMVDDTTKCEFIKVIEQTYA